MSGLPNVDPAGSKNLGHPLDPEISSSERRLDLALREQSQLMSFSSPLEAIRGADQVERLRIWAQSH